MKNKAVLCKPLTMTKATYCKPHMQTKSCQTGNLGQCDLNTSPYLHLYMLFLNGTASRIDSFGQFVIFCWFCLSNFRYYLENTASHFKSLWSISDKGLEYKLCQSEKILYQKFPLSLWFVMVTILFPSCQNEMKLFKHVFFIKFTVLSVF